MKPPSSGRSGGGNRPPRGPSGPNRPPGGGPGGGTRWQGGGGRDQPRGPSRPPTGPRADSSRPRDERNRDDRPRPERPRADQPRPYVARDAGPRPDRSRPDIPRPDRPREDRPQAVRSELRTRRDDTPRGEQTSRPPQGRIVGPPRGHRARQDGPRANRGGPEPGDSDAAPRGSLWLYGSHAVAAALANPARRLRRLLLTEEAESALLDRLPQPWSIPHERTDRDRIDRLLGRDAVHQGAALLADPLAVPLLAQTLERPGPVLVLDQVTDPRNVGAILRAAAAFGAAAVVTQDRNAPEETGAMAKAASGALETVPLLRAVNIARTLVALKAANFWVVGLDAKAPPLSGPALAQRRVALVLGAEGEGMRRLTRETCDETAALAMPGGTDSLNVAAAAAVALYELSRHAS